MPHIIFSDYSKPSFLEKTVSFLDSCFYLEGKQTYVVARDPQDRFLSVTVPGKTLSTCEKVLKIISWVLIPLTIIALALRNLLHAYLSYKGRIVCLDSLVSAEERQLLISCPDVLQNIRRLPLIYRFLPLEDCFISFDSTDSSKLKNMSFWVNYPKLSSKINLSGIQIPLYKRKKVKKSPQGDPSDFPINFPMLCREILKNESDNILSHGGMEKLTRLFLAFLIYKSQKNADGTIQTAIPLGRPDTLWAKLLFFDYSDEDPLTQGLLGSRVLKELERLGILGSAEKHFYSANKVIIYWPPRKV
ncbi:hypothetical protein [Chlamydia felis Fe/C-56]|uniref:Uncharacterized protein n=1 Tax=Chlamydia felis (strain Fe/C-56) TaxID=264202 RepID=Q254R8_CHLFF|nr:DUF648 domain-containing protein [Chlamydia felis]BAE81220.1 hypothetical protein [Chlamydia felis Fe/C-56]